MAEDILGDEGSMQWSLVDKELAWHPRGRDSEIVNLQSLR